MLQMQAGGEIDLKVYVKYDQGGNDTNVGATGLVAALGNMFGSASSPGEDGSAFNLFDQAAQTMTGFMTGEGGTEPDAYLQYLFFDKDFNFTGTLGDGYDFDKVDADAALSQHDSLSLSRTFTEDGYLFVFISNSSAEIPVYFDDLTIDYTMSPIDQANDYYPFGGLMGSGFERIISKTNDFRYQGKEYDKDLQWYDFHARQYDPYLGRFLAADPLMQFSSTYNGMGNNPINLIDPTGMSARGTRLDGIAEEDDDQDDEVNAVSNGTSADEWERQKAAHHAQFINWLGGMNSTYGHSLHAANTYGMGNGSFGSAGHYQYAKNHGAQTVNYYNKNAVNNYNGAMVLPEMTSTTRRDPFNAPGQQSGGTPDPSSQLGLIDHSDPIGLASTVWGGSVSIGAADAAASGKYLANVVKYTKVGGNILGGVGTAVTFYNVAAETYNGTVNTSDLVDLTASGGLLITGLLISNPIGLGVVAVAGIGYGIYRIGWGDSADAAIDEHFGFNNK